MQPSLVPANHARLHRAAISRELRGRTLPFAELDLDDPLLARMRVFDLLRRLPWHNRRYTLERGYPAQIGPQRVMRAMCLKPSARVEDLSSSRKHELKCTVRELCPTQR